MRVSTITLVLAPIAVQAMPFEPINLPIQQNLRRAIDFPHNSQRSRAQQRAKRAGGYSVVQVDGGSSTTAPPSPPHTATLLQTVTNAASSITSNTQTVVLTTTIPGPLSAQTILITTTQKLQQTVTEAPSVATAPPGTTRESPPAVPLTSTIYDMVTSTAIASQPVSYYDDGLWHTRYPVKNFEASSVGSFATIMPIATPAGASPVSLTGSNPSAAASSLDPRPSTVATPLPSSTWSSSPVSTWSEATSHYQSWTPSSTAYSTWTSSSVSSWSAAQTQPGAWTSSAVNNWSAAPSQAQSGAWTPANERVGVNATAWQTHQARKAPLDIKVANWSETKTESDLVQTE